ncbi:5-oxoprolinase subunit B family protein [Pseudodonghicola flavimaris]|uniref:Carboxyltransferase domain-containing protein n=1 Tax=Pseudodonghicola flavimaris TaxID=3050036 RepID=A0ABT7EW82_9RHOB|nr:carboxyltransferase domain-containing protein [Pseudodonghicola flavimaris]MDK3016591.1 carboxyltransferase domain-containing protein [Pseudodonghicola flavimaris]
MTAAQMRTGISFPAIRPVGLTGLLVSFSDRLEEPANRAALAFRAAVEAAAWPGVEETSTSLASSYLRFDPLILSPEALTERLRALLSTRDWRAAPLPPGRRLFRVPTLYGTDLAPQLAEAAAEAGLSPEAAIADLGATRVRVLTIGFAPGQPYLGELGTAWDLPRQSALTARVPAGALVLAVRQLTLFTAPAPTGWRHVGQTRFRCFRPEAPDPFPLSPGDEMIFAPVSRADYDRLGDVTDHGLRIEEIAG